MDGKDVCAKYERRNEKETRGGWLGTQGLIRSLKQQKSLQNSFHSIGQNHANKAE